MFFKSFDNGWWLAALTASRYSTRFSVLAKPRENHWLVFPGVGLYNPRKGITSAQLRNSVFGLCQTMREPLASDVGLQPGKVIKRSALQLGVRSWPNPREPLASFPRCGALQPEERDHKRSAMQLGVRSWPNPARTIG